ncbi:porin [Burkholderia ubonensis]|uniref:porin n=1 Tax=Burkholderia ubonensis TaxID=101571 RepID=UPI00075627F4|nr:porin [Burkholderia ubonensis]KVU69470.1 porin [Burkholderia ubonensis]KVU83269.1 porin [Burkholderia ubonensis]KWH12657.1 porin [Burkholderia ubonensis]
MNRHESLRAVCCAMMVLACAAAHAQSSITLYGVLDAGIRYETHGVSYGPDGTPASTGRKVSMADGGGLTESYWGLKGNEDLGGGLSAQFNVESHFGPNSGSIVPAGSVNFFQIAYVGLTSSTLGQLTLGRQYDVAFESVSLSYGSNLWAGQQDPYFNLFKPEQTMLAAARTSNMIQYGAQLGGFYLLAQYAPGGRAGGGVLGSQLGAAVAYAPDKGPFTLGASFMRSRDDVTQAKFDIYSGGGSLTIGDATVNAGYIENARDNDFTSFANGPFSPSDLAGLGIISPAQVADPNVPGGFRRRKMVLAGLTYRITPVLTAAVNAWWTTQSGYTADFDGRARQFQVIGGYSLSKRDMLYAEVDYAIYRGGLIGAQLVGINGQAPSTSTTQLGATVGLRHYF